jgi:hypothetical protein
MNNINGSKLNNDNLWRSGSGYVASHKKDFLDMNDSWSQWLNFKYDASGSVFAIDWYDQNQCHSPNPDVHDKTLGRIFKISHKDDKWVQVNLYRASDMELVDYQLHENEWYVRQARTILQERGGSPEIYAALKKILTDNPDTTRKLRAMWTLHVTDGLSEDDMAGLLDHSDEYIRSWAVQLITEDKSVSSATLSNFADMAKNDGSALVRLYLISGMLRLEPQQRWEVLDALAQRSEDVDDHNIPLMLWYALEPLVAVDAGRALKIAEKSDMPRLLEYTIRRAGDINTPQTKKLLKDLQGRLAKEASVKNDSIKILIDSFLKV